MSLGDKTIKNGGPAFPSLHYSAVEGGEEVNEYANFEGMTLRDYFAGQALTGILAFSETTSRGSSPEYAANDAYKYADAMLEARGM